jgi:hypothetical protein
MIRGLAAAAGILALVGAANAQGAFCTRNSQRGTDNCGFDTIQKCRESLPGAGTCYPNPAFKAPATIEGPAAKSKRVRKKRR